MLFEKLFKNKSFWKHLTNFWTFLFFSVIIFDWITQNALLEFLEILAFIYVAILAIYAGNKEFERWYAKKSQAHPGEIFVLLWTALIFIIEVIDMVLNQDYKMPSAVISSYIAVLTILAITEKSKSLYRDRRHRKR